MQPRRTNPGSSPPAARSESPDAESSRTNRTAALFNVSGSARANGALPPRVYSGFGSSVTLFIERSISLRIKPLNGLMNTQYRRRRLLLASSKQSTLVSVASRVVSSSCSDSEKFQAALAYPGLLKLRNPPTPNRCMSPEGVQKRPTKPSKSSCGGFSPRRINPLLSNPSSVRPRRSSPRWEECHRAGSSRSRKSQRMALEQLKSKARTASYTSSTGA